MGAENDTRSRAETGPDFDETDELGPKDISARAMATNGDWDHQKIALGGYGISAANRSKYKSMESTRCPEVAEVSHTETKQNKKRTAAQVLEDESEDNKSRKFQKHQSMETPADDFQQHDHSRQQKLKEFEYLIDKSTALFAGLDHPAKITILNRMPVLNLFTQFAAPPLRNLCQAALRAGARRAEDASIKVSLLEDVTDGQNMLEADWQNDFEAPSCTPNKPLPGHSRHTPTPTATASDSRPELVESEEEDLAELTESEEADLNEDLSQEELEILVFSDHLVNIGYTNQSQKDVETAYDFVCDIDIHEHSNRLQHLMVEFRSLKVPGQMDDDAMTDSLDLEILVNRVKVDVLDSKALQFTEAWNQIALAYAVEAAFKAHKSGGWKSEPDMENKEKPLPSKDWHTRWLVQVIDDQRIKGEPVWSRAKWSSKLNQGRRWAEWCQFLSGGSLPQHRGALLLLLVLRSRRGTSAWSTCRKILTGIQFKYTQEWIKRWIPEYIELATILNRFAGEIYVAKQLSDESFDRFTSDLSGYFRTINCMELPTLGDADNLVKEEEEIHNSRARENMLCTSIRSPSRDEEAVEDYEESI